LKRRKGPPQPPKSAKPSTVSQRTTHTTVRSGRLDEEHPRVKHQRPPAVRRERTLTPPARQVARIIDEDEASLLDLIDNLLQKGVMLNADLILALADVDLIYVRLSALLCAADRIAPRLRHGGAVAASRRARE
jgi:hypothetical protein